MVGRRHDREEVLRLLGLNAVITLTGPGGVGKTRLALDIAAEPTDGDAVAVGLAAVDRPERVCQAVASALDLRTVGEVRPSDDEAFRHPAAHRLCQVRHRREVGLAAMVEPVEKLLGAQFRLLRVQPRLLQHLANLGPRQS